MADAHSSAPSQNSKLAAFAPLKNSLFRALWIASVASNVGTLVQTVGQGWLMTSLTASPIVIALVQTAESLAVFLFALPGGALADLVHRRTLLLITQIWMSLIAALLGGMTLLGWTTAPLLLLSTFLLSAGSALNTPAWQTSIPDIV